MKRSITAVLLGAALVFGGAAAAPAAMAAEEPAPDPQIAEMLETVPGGVLIDENHAVWPELDMEMTTAEIVSPVAARALSTAASVGLCPTGKVCAFGLYATTGSRITWGTCDDAHPVGSFTVRSIADARSSGYAQARYGTTVRATAHAGTWKNVYGTVSRITCVS